jgi:hypothetical protein
VKQANVHIVLSRALQWYGTKGEGPKEAHNLGGLQHDHIQTKQTNTFLDTFIVQNIFLRKKLKPH